MDLFDRMTDRSYIISRQIISVLLATLGGYLWNPEEFRLAISIFYGGGITILASLILAWRLGRATQLAADKDDKAILYLYLGSIERLVIAVACFALGVLKLKLDILPMVVGLISGQLGFLIGGMKSRI